MNAASVACAESGAAGTRNASTANRANREGQANRAKWASWLNWARTDLIGDVGWGVGDQPEHALGGRQTKGAARGRTLPRVHERVALLHQRERAPVNGALPVTHQEALHRDDASPTRERAGIHRGRQTDQAVRGGLLMPHLGVAR